MGCEYCEKQRDNKPIHYEEWGSDNLRNNYLSVEVWDWGLEVEVRIAYGTTGESIEINYCPMCGRKLKEEEDEA